MARYILCEHCNTTLTASSKKYGEFYESIEGIAKKQMFCDGSCGGAEATEIEVGDKCFAAVMLPSKSHPNYQSHNPVNWAADYIKSETLSNE